MLIGTLLAAYALLTNQASVLYTFYPPLKAHPTFYIGATLLVVGSWIAILNTVLTFLRWRKKNPGVKTPGPMVGVIATYTVWFLATIGIAILALFFLIPWSLGFLKGINPTLSRTLFWWFGHPLVYFWLLPAYITWYYIIPKVAGGKLYSSLAARLAFIMFYSLFRSRGSSPPVLGSRNNQHIQSSSCILHSYGRGTFPDHRLYRCRVSRV